MDEEMFVTDETKLVDDLGIGDTDLDVIVENIDADDNATGTKVHVDKMILNAGSSMPSLIDLGKAGVAVGAGMAVGTAVGAAVGKATKWGYHKFKSVCEERKEKKEAKKAEKEAKKKSKDDVVDVKSEEIVSDEKKTEEKTTTKKK